jgi:putative modified peptide
MAGTPLAPDLVDELLHKLGSDDQFRAAFADDPEAAVGGLGAAGSQKAGPLKLGPCLRPVKLASKDEIQRTRATIRETLLGKGSHEVHCLEAE